MKIITGSLLNILQFTGIGIIAGLMLVIIFIVLDIPNSFEIPPQYTWIAFFSIGVQAAITEELLFRGYFLSDLIRYGFNITFALIFQAMVFAILHLSVYPDNLLAIFVVFLVGLISGLLTLKSKSLIPAFTLHIVFNILTVVWWMTTR